MAQSQDSTRQPGDDPAENEWETSSSGSSSSVTDDEPLSYLKMAGDAGPPSDWEGPFDSDDDSDDESVDPREQYLEAADDWRPSPSTYRSAPASGDLGSRVQAFLPQLQQANADLDDEGNLERRRIDHVSGDEEEYIEMNLGLGVLSEQKGDGEDELQVAESGSDGEEESTGADPSAVDRGPEQDVLSRLKGQNAQRGTKRKVKELGEV